MSEEHQYTSSSVGLLSSIPLLHHPHSNQPSPNSPQLPSPYNNQLLSPQPQDSDSGFSPGGVPSDMDLQLLLSPRTFSPQPQPQPQLFSPQPQGSDSGFSPGGGPSDITLNQLLSPQAQGHAQVGYQQIHQYEQEQETLYQQTESGTDSHSEQNFNDYNYQLHHNHRLDNSHRLDHHAQLDHGQDPSLELQPNQQSGPQCEQMTQLRMPLQNQLQPQTGPYSPLELAHTHHLNIHAPEHTHSNTQTRVLIHTAQPGHTPTHTHYSLQAYPAPSTHTPHPLSSHLYSQRYEQGDAQQEWRHAHTHFPYTHTHVQSPYTFAHSHAEETQGLYMYQTESQGPIEHLSSQQRFSPLSLGFRQGVLSTQTSMELLPSPCIKGVSNLHHDPSYTPNPYSSPGTSPYADLNPCPSPKEESPGLGNHNRHHSLPLTPYSPLPHSYLQPGSQSSPTPQTNPYSYSQTYHPSQPSPHYQTNPNPHLFLPQSPVPLPSPFPPPPPLVQGQGWGEEPGAGAVAKPLTRERTGTRPNLLHSSTASQTQIRLTQYSEHLGNLNSRRLMCSVCQRDFKSLPALNGHMRSHGRQQRQTVKTHPSQREREEEAPGSADSLCPVAMVMPVSMPVHLPTFPTQPEHREQTGAPKRGNRKHPHRPSPLLLPTVIIPTPSPLPRGISLFQSLLRVVAGNGEVSGGDGAFYTPPPMLCPVRDGTGLYCSLSTRGQQRAHIVLLHNSDRSVDSSVAMVTPRPREQSVEIKPRINVGSCFQAEIPPLFERRQAAIDPHYALLLWTPWDDLETVATQQRVKAFLMMACSCVVPGGGVNSEYALHALSESRGDFLVTLEKLLLSAPGMQPLTSYHYTGCDRWTPAERRLVNKAINLYQKDFSRIQKMVQTKSLAQCVEFYYLWKKRLRLNIRTPSEVALTLPEANDRTPNGLSENYATVDMRGHEVTDPFSANQELPNFRSPKVLEPAACQSLSCVGGLSKSGEVCCSSSTPVLDGVKPSWSHHSGLGSLGGSPAPSSLGSRPSPQTTAIYPCKECSKVFTKVKSRNAHMKTHRQQDDSPVVYMPQKATSCPRPRPHLPAPTPTPHHSAPGPAPISQPTIYQPQSPSCPSTRPRLPAPDPISQPQIRCACD
ncbi:transcriptional-regulating factor 1 [Osmerus mordax]|uniref:transcriptional-regulating factor 1 n=1 Tax=Osmerus mordax TaxID=8014 RepID=UPI003510B660